MALTKEDIVEVISKIDFADGAMSFHNGWFTRQWMGEDRREILDNPYIYASIQFDGETLNSRKVPIEHDASKTQVIRACRIAMLYLTKYVSDLSFTYEGKALFDPRQKLTDE